MEFNTRLTSLRKERNLLQADVANKVGIARATYGAYEQGSRQPDFDTLEKLADFFGVSLDYLLGRTNISALTPQEKDEAAFQAFANDPELNVFYKELPESDEEAVRMLRNIWEIIKNEKK
ncbi:helix-turn-helix transcriptional regulator [Lysinibacillus sp. CD3-6]|uniref:helix-turn-helix domain-containing protein n=1 Tax=Lysinibacillus sp. CD3-6 TaxID=2892541 RepID=UPI00116C37C9|nr:helix-turn-helix transcriptional regulator [Lysinibacillus sp. CD3-6]UED78401.1 helix-turn-helix transcriptional regulator [Lysinibacillus sp. CD3-6]